MHSTKAKYAGVHAIVSPTLNGKLKMEYPYITINNIEKTLIPRKPERNQKNNTTNTANATAIK